MGEKIPDGITAEHVEAAIRDFNAGKAHKFGSSTQYVLVHGDKRYPPKAILGLAAEYILGHQLGPGDFSGGSKSKCFRILTQLGYKVESKK